MLKLERIHLPKKLVIAVLIGITVILSVLIILKKIKPVSAAWFDDSWAYRRAIPVTNNTTTESNVFISITGIDASDTTKFQADCGDIRFTDIKGTILPYYLATACGASTTIHVNFVTFPAGAQIIYMYYGNPSAADGFVGADFANPASDYTVGDLALEEQSPGPIAYWKFDEGAENTCSAGVNDVCNSGSGSTTLDGISTATRIIAGKIGRALDFDGTDDVVTVTNTAAIDLNNGLVNAFTFSAWINADTDGEGHAGQIFWKGNSTYLRVSGLSGSNLNIDASLDLATTATKSLSAPITTGTWNHLVMVYDSSTAQITLYVNGVNMGSSTNGVGAPNADTNNLLIGGTTTANFDGKIDEVKVYNYALTASQVKVDYNRASSAVLGALSDNSSYEKLSANQEFCVPGDTTACAAPIDEWKFEEGSGAVAYDTGSNKNNGALTGNTYYSTGKVGKDLFFDGDGDYVKVTHNANLVPTRDITITAWVKPYGYTAGSYNEYGNIVHKHRGTTAGVSVYSLSIQKSGTIPYFEITTANGSYGVFGTTTLAIGTWYHLTGRYNGSYIQMFVNGKYEGQTAATGNLVASTSCAVYFGGGQYNSCNWENRYRLNGDIDQIRIYDYARSNAQIAWEYAQTKAQGWWKFDEGTGTTLYNSGNLGSTIDATASGTTWSNSGKYGKAIQYNGTSGYSSTPKVAILAGNALTYNTVSWGGWVNPTTSAANKSIIIKNNEFKLTTDSDSKANCAIYSGSWQDATISSDAIPLNAWSHIFCTYDGANVKTYINGAQSGTPPSQTNNLTSSNTTGLNLGWNTAGGEYFSGLMDEAKVYNYALTANQIKTEYNHTSPIVLGALSDNSSYEKLAANQEYCVPGETATCVAPVGEWKMEEGSGVSAFDTSGNGNTGTATGTTITTGKIGKARSFATSSDYISINDNNSLDASSGLTMEAWIYPTVLGTTERNIVNKGTTADTGYGLEISSLGTLYAWADSDGGWGPTWQAICPTTSCLSVNNWQHIVGVFDGSQMKLYVNGVYIVASASSANTIHNSAQPVIIGYHSGWTNPFVGKIDNVRIFNYARTPAQILWDYNRGVPTAYWKFDECQGGTMYDSSGNAYNGTWYGTGGGTQTSVGTCTTASTAWGNGVTGKFNSSLNFDGSDDYVSLGTGLNLTDFTISAWIKKSSTGQAYPPIIMKNNSANNYYIYCLSHDDTDHLRLLFNPNDDAGGSAWYVTSNTAHADTAWHHVVGTKSGTTVAIYVDGVSEATTTTGTPNSVLASTTGNILIGKSYDSRMFAGLIDDARIYNYALTATQIKQLYDQGSSVRFGPLQGIP